MKVYSNITELIGNTPIVKINKVNTGTANIYAKLESFNPLSSVKDRVGYALIEEARKDGILKENGVIVEPTSGNTGIALAYISAVYGYKIILTMPETMSIERRKLLKSLGAEIVLTEGAKGMKGAIEKAEEIVAKTPNAYMPQQFCNNYNKEMHKKTTGPEIWQAMDGKVDIFVSGVGTGGTITGAGEYLKEQNSNIFIAAVEPKSSPVLSGGQAGPHKIQGIGAGFIPDILNTKIYNEVICIDNDDALDMAKNLAKQEGIFAGISSGAAMKAAIELSKREENKGKNIVVVLPDTGERYLSIFEAD